jgi:2',3'-cyclic-nucleotide 2'-phosphodiesterase (5'-nucleotidase family)
MLTILHTNDLHNGLGLLPRLATLVARERARVPHTVLLDAGDTALGDPTAAPATKHPKTPPRISRSARWRHFRLVGGLL